MSYWIKGQPIELGEALISWRCRSVSRMFIKILTWLLSAFVLAILLAIVLGPFDPHDNAHPYVRGFFLILLAYGIISAFVQNVYQGQKYLIAEKALISCQPLWKGGFLMAWLRERMGKTQKFVEYIPWDNVSKVSKTGKHLLVELKDGGGSLTVTVSPVLEFKRAAGGAKIVARRIDGLWARMFQTDKKLDKDALQQIIEKAQSASHALRESTGPKRKRK